MQISLDKAIKIARSTGIPFLVLKHQKDTLNIYSYSETAPQILGYTSEEFLKIDNLFDAISEYDIEYMKKGFFRCIESDEPYSLNVRIIHEGKSPSVLTGICNYIDNENSCSFFLCYLTDESKKKTYYENEENDSVKHMEDILSFGGIQTWCFDIVNDRIINISSSHKFVDSGFMNNYPIELINSGIIDSKDASDYLANIEALKNGIETITFENWYHLPDSKQPKYLRVKYITDFDDNHKPVLAHGMCIDLTEAKNAELNFEHRTNAVLRMTPDSIASLQINITENTCSSSSAAHASFSQLLTSKSVDDLVASCVSLMADKNERIHFINAFSRGSLLASFNSGILQVKLEHHMTMKNNHEEWVRTVVDIVKNPITNEVEAVMQIINIHHQKVIDSMMNGTVQREFDFIALAYIKTNSYVLIDRFNQTMKEESPDFVEKFRIMFETLIQIPEELDRVLSEFTIENLVEKINTYGEYILQFNSNKDPEKNHHRLIRFSFLNNRRDIISISCRDNTKLYNDAQEQKRKLSDALFEAEKANRAKSDFLSLVSHDIRTPLNGIMGMTQLALKEENQDKVRKYLKKAEMSSSFLLGLINDLLDMSKIESGKVELHPEPYEYKEFIEYINCVIRPLMQKKNLKFTIHGTNMASKVLIDKLRFNQIMFNLLSNSCKYTNEGGSIQFRMNCEKVNDSLCIGTFMVKDNGIGMSEEFQNHLFETFSQENRMSFDHNEGTGLGLSITHSLIELMGGEITVESELNKGTTFTVQLTFPVLDEDIEPDIIEENLAAEKTNEETIKKLNYNGKKFLLCEDNIINQEIAIEILTNLGAMVDVADDGQIGVKKFKESSLNEYSAVFMDIRMPNMDGLTASKEIRSLNREDAENVPIIAMTANAMSEDKMECIEAGMNAFIPKPINVKELYLLMSKIIE